MSTKTLRTMAVAVVLALSAPSGAFAAGPNGPGIPAIAPYTAPTAEEAIDLTYMRGEEKFSRDLYLGFAESWDIAPFAFVANAEQRHMDAVLRALRRYGLPDPVAGTLAGEFRDAELQSLYAALLEKGLASPFDALRVGGLVEEIDLLDLEFSECARRTRTSPACTKTSRAVPAITCERSPKASGRSPARPTSRKRCRRRLSMRSCSSRGSAVAVCSAVHRAERLPGREDRCAACAGTGVKAPRCPA